MSDPRPKSGNSGVLPVVVILVVGLLLVVPCGLAVVGGGFYFLLHSVESESPVPPPSVSAPIEYDESAAFEPTPPVKPSE